MLPKLLVSDLDDSLLRDDQTLSPRTLCALNQLRARGCRVALASGRMVSSVRRYWNELRLETPIIACNGSQLYDPVNEVLLHREYIDAPLAREVALLLESHGCYVQSYADHDYFYAERCEHSETYERIAGVYGVPLGKPVSQSIEAPMPKLLMIGERERINQMLLIARDRFGDSLEIAISKPIYLEFTHPSATKGNALARLAAMYGIAARDVVACGDALNDISMLAYAGTGVAVANARPETLACADVVVPCNAEDGIAQYIEQLLARGEGAQI